MKIYLDNGTLDSINFSGDNIKSHLSEMVSYFYKPSGQEHYRLLTFLASFWTGCKLFDVGTFKGSSALALSLNPSNSIESYNIVDQLDVNFSDISNINFHIKEIITDESSNRELAASPFVLYDIAPHDGRLELEFYHHLSNIGFRGVALFDDIHLNPDMNNFWEKITHPKIDATPYGHGSGSGLVLFGDDVEFILK